MRPKGRQGKQLGHYVAPELVEKLKILSKQMELPQSHLVEEALKLLFDKHAADLNPKAGKARK
jgi:hypothetical protein